MALLRESPAVGLFLFIILFLFLFIILLLFNSILFYLIFIFILFYFYFSIFLFVLLSNNVIESPMCFRCVTKVFKQLVPHQITLIATYRRLIVVL